MHRPGFPRQFARRGDRRSSHRFDSTSAPTPGGKVDDNREDELERLHMELETAAEFVFQQRLAIHRLNGGASFSEGADQSMQTSCNSAEYKTALNQLIDLEDNLSQNANRCIQTSNVTALHLLNEKQYSHALNILLRVEAIVQKGSGKWFPFLLNTECVVQNINGSGEDTRSGDERHMQGIFVPFFTKRHETKRQLALAVIENNIGLYHFKIAEYKLAAQRIFRALQLEEANSVETIGVTYFNLAQTQYELGNMEDAFSAISLAEDAIEKQLHEFQSQRNYLSRITEHGDHVSTTTMTGLEKRKLSVYISWREAVCMLARVLEAHGSWLQNTGAYMAAIHCYHKSDRWLLSVKGLSAEEKSQRQELQLRIRECKRSQRHNRCVPKSASMSTFMPSGNTSAPPRSIIVTTALPSRIELTTSESPIEVKEGNVDRKESNVTVRERKPRYKDVNKMSAGVNGKNYGNSLLSHIYSTATRAHGRRTSFHRPLWDSSTTAIRSDTTRSRTAASNSFSCGNSETRTLSRLDSGTEAPFSREETNERRLSECPVSTIDMKKTTSRGRTPAQVKTSAYRHSSLMGIRVPAKRFSRSVENGEKMSSFSLGNVRVLSLVRCIHILQAFARAKMSIVEKEWRQHASEFGIVSATSFSSYSLSSLSMSLSGEALNTSYTPLCVQKENPLPGRRSLCKSAFPEFCDVLMAFFAAYRSTYLVHQRYIEQRYTTIMKEVGVQRLCEDKSSPSFMKIRMGDITRRKAWEHTQQQQQQQRHSLSGRLISSTALVKDVVYRNGQIRNGCEEETLPLTCHDYNVNGICVSKERFSRRYNSLLRMFPQGEGRTISYQASAVAKGLNSCLNGKLDPPVNGGADFRVCYGLPVTPHMSEGSGSHSEVADSLISSTQRNFLLKTHSVMGRAATVPPKVSINAHSYYGHHHNTAGGVEYSAYEMLNENELRYMHGGVPFCQPIFRGTALFLSHEKGEQSVCVTADFIQQRVLREEAAIIIQGAWRRWRARRQLEAVRGLFL